MACATFTRPLIDQKSRFCTQNARSIFGAHETAFISRPMVQEVVRSILSLGTRATFSVRMANQHCVDAVLETGPLHQMRSSSMLKPCYFLDGRCPALRLGIHKRREGSGRVTQRPETEVRHSGLHVRQAKRTMQPISTASLSMTGIGACTPLAVVAGRSP